VDDLQVEHEQTHPYHWREDDLGEFFHIHPIKIEPGLCRCNTCLPTRNYKIWTDVKYHGTSYAFEHPVLTVTGNIGETAANLEPGDRAVKSGYQITLNHSEPLRAGRTNQLQSSFATRLATRRGWTTSSARPCICHREG